MDKTKDKKKKIHHQHKLSFGSALKQNVRIIIINDFYDEQLSQSASQGKKLKKSSMNKINGQKKVNAPSISVSKIDESYNADRAPDTFNGKEDFNDNNIENKGYLQDIPSENSSVQTSNRVS